MGSAQSVLRHETTTVDLRLRVPRDAGIRAQVEELECAHRRTVDHIVWLEAQVAALRDSVGLPPNAADTDWARTMRAQHESAVQEIMRRHRCTRDAAAEIARDSESARYRCIPLPSNTR